MCSDQVQEELSRVVGSRHVRVEDRKNLPYIDAVIHEIQRLANVVPMAIPHKTSRDVTFQGYFIKKVGRLRNWEYFKFSLRVFKDTLTLTLLLSLAYRGRLCFLF